MGEIWQSDQRLFSQQQQHQQPPSPGYFPLKQHTLLKSLWTNEKISAIVKLLPFKTKGKLHIESFETDPGFNRLSHKRRLNTEVG